MFNQTTLKFFTFSIVNLTVIVSYSHITNSQSISNSNSSPQYLAEIPQQELDKIAQAITVKVHVGDNRGSGILLTKDNNTYTVITNHHVIDVADGYSIETPDGIKHQAQVIAKDGSETGNDLAVLQFTSTKSYQVAKIGNSTNLTEGETVITAGFPYDGDSLNITSGEINLISNKPLKGGYQIGFTNQTVQGMSGGVLLNANGEVIGVLGKGNIAILENTAYQYQDGSQPTEEMKAKFRESSFSIPIVKVKEVAPQFASLIPDGDIAQNPPNNPNPPEKNPDIAQNPTPTIPTPKKNYTGIVKTVNDVAQQVTVRIDTTKANGEKGNGSGVIIAKQGNTYYVATARHVFCTDENVSNKDCEDKKNNNTNPDVEIVTPDGKSYELDYDTVELILGYDALIFSFESKENYQVAEIGNYEVAFNGNQVLFVSGFPRLEKNRTPERIITGGFMRRKEYISGLNIDDLWGDGTGLAYTNLSYRGMSGGGVFDTEGRLVGINTSAENKHYVSDEGNYDQYSIGFSLGVSITDVVKFLQNKELTLQSQWLTSFKQPPQRITTDSTDWKEIERQLLNPIKPKEDKDIIALMNYGNQLWRFTKYDEAISVFRKVIELNPEFVDQVYFALGTSYLDLGDSDLNRRNKSYLMARMAFQKAIDINDNPYEYWRRLAKTYDILGENDLALPYYNEAIDRYEKDKNTKNNDGFVLYLERGVIYHDLGNYQLALDDYNQAQKMNPNHPWIYLEIGITYTKQEDYEKALIYYDKALEINSELAIIYNNRGAMYHNSGNYQKAIDDYNKAIKIYSDNATNVNNRNRNPELAKTYQDRGKSHFELKNYQQAIDDFSKAIEIIPKYTDAYHNRGRLYLELENYQQAINDFTEVINTTLIWAVPYHLRGTAYISLGNIQKARKDLEVARDLYCQGDNAQSCQMTIKHLALLEQLTNNSDNNSNSLGNENLSAEDYFVHGYIKFKSDKHQDAIDDFNQAIEIDNEFAKAYLYRGMIYIHLYNFEQSRKDLEKSRDLFDQQDDLQGYKQAIRFLEMLRGI